MFAARGSIWGPPPLPEFLTKQLVANGLTADDAGRCARRINEGASGAEAASLFVDLGACKYLEGDIDGAIAAWRHAISSRDDAAASRGLLNLGLLYEHLHLHDRAIGLLEAVASRDVDPYVISAAMASARCFLARGEGERAMETMARLAQRTMAHEPESTELISTLYGLGEVADVAGRPDRAERAWQVAAAGPSSDVQRAARSRLVALLQHQGRLDETLAYLDASTLGDPTAHSVALDLIEAFSAIGDDAQARELASSVTAAELGSSEQFRLAALRWRSGLVNEAIDVLEVLLSDGNDGAQLRAAYLLGQIYAGYDMVGPAQSMFERVIGADDRSWSPKAALALGDLYEAERDHDAAVRHWTRAAASPITAVHELATSRLVNEPVATGQFVDLDDSASVAASRDPEPPTSESVEDQRSTPEPEFELEPEPAPADELTLVEPEPLVVDDATARDPEPAVEQHDRIPPEPVVAQVADAESAPDEPLEPVVVVLDSLSENDGATAKDSSDAPGVLLSAGQGASNTASAFASHLDDSDGELSSGNPYAALAPDDDQVEIVASTRNPYAELAPDFDDGQYEPPIDVEPGDWQSMLEDWPETSGTPAPDEGADARPSAFSRYT